MKQELEGRVRYDKDSDSFVYEIRTVNELENGDEELGEWGMCMMAQCVRREGAEDGEDTNYIHFNILKQVARDAQIGVRISLA